MSIADLWLPILLSGLATHVISMLAWMLLPHHKPEWNKLAEEDEFIDWVDAKQIPTAQYVFPHCENPEDMKNPEFKEKQNKCRGTLILWPEPPNMGANIGKTLFFFFVAATLIGLLSSMGLSPGASFGSVFQFVFLATLLTHCAGQFPGVFWFKRKFAMDLLDGLAHSLATALIFAAFWP